MHIRKVTSLDTVVHLAARRLEAATSSGQVCEPVRDLLGSTDIALAYRVQNQINANRVARGSTIIGRKVGLTSAAVQNQLGVNQPDFGVLFDDMQCSDGGTVPMTRLLQPRAEAEIAFILSTDLSAGNLDVDQVRAAVAFAVPALEIVDSRVRNWNIEITDTVADNASSGMFVLGANRMTLDEFVPRDVAMTLTVDGHDVSAGTGADCLGDPIAALAWLARTACAVGSPLRAGDVVLSGALGPMVAVGSGRTVRAELSCLGNVSATFA